MPFAYSMYFLLGAGCVVRRHGAQAVVERHTNAPSSRASTELAGSCRLTCDAAMQDNQLLAMALAAHAISNKIRAFVVALE